MPLVGGANIQEVRDAGGTACDLAQISGVDAEGRAGSLRTTFLFALFGAVEAVTSLNSLFDTIGGFSLYAPYSHPVPSNPAATDFDYSALIPVCRASLIAANFQPVARAWPASMDAYLSVANLNAPGQVYQLQVVPISVNPTVPTTQYGEYNFSIRGGIPDTDNPILSPLILVEVDFSHSVGN
jgi:hypothetical protein